MATSTWGTTVLQGYLSIPKIRKCGKQDNVNTFLQLVLSQYLDSPSLYRTFLELCSMKSASFPYSIKRLQNQSLPRVLTSQRATQPQRRKHSSVGCKLVTHQLTRLSYVNLSDPTISIYYSVFTEEIIISTFI